jgi:hypothetical protein
MGRSADSDTELNEEETARRRDDALLRALNTPPKHHSEMKLGKRKPKPKEKATWQFRRKTK